MKWIYIQGGAWTSKGISIGRTAIGEEGRNLWLNGSPQALLEFSSPSRVSLLCTALSLQVSGEFSTMA